MKKTAAIILLISVCLAFCACSGTGGESATETKTNVPEAGYTIRIENTTVAVREEASDVLAALGTPKSREATGSCAYGGEDVRYTFDHLILLTYENGGKEYVSQVSLADDTYATSEGIRIGDGADKVKSTYGTPANESETSVSYIKGNTKLLFLIRDGNVTNIQYLIA